MNIIETIDLTKDNEMNNEDIKLNESGVENLTKEKNTKYKSNKN
jgi:hypothetical protein